MPSLLMPTSVMQNLEKIVTDLAQQQGCELYDIEFGSGPGGRVLRIFLDKQAGIGIDECTHVSRALTEVLDANEDLVPGGQYDLEVSSPGLERTLRKNSHFKAALGKKAQFKINKALESFGVTAAAFKLGKQFQAQIENVEGELVSLKVGSEIAAVPISEISKANLVFEIEEQGAHSKPKDNEKNKKKSKK